jgi:16S rRNA (cytosine1402-N4)-methyltransferase
MTDQVLEALSPRDGGRYVDATLGGGGHAELILQASAPNGRLLGIDRDPDAIKAASLRLSSYMPRLQVICGRFSQIKEILKESQFAEEGEEPVQVDGILVDAGVSSYQFDEPQRGFSFRNPGPLDMRMGQTGITCGELLDQLEEGDLARLLREFGEVRYSRRVARAILSARSKGHLNTTGELARVTSDAMGWRARRAPGRKQIHPATTVFQALRIAVNQELEELKVFCEEVPQLLKPGGIAVVISFHRLEDRIVKRAFRRHTSGAEVPAAVPLTEKERGKGPLELLTRKSMVPSEEEIALNPRARSARLRAAKRRFD